MPRAVVDVVDDPSDVLCSRRSEVRSRLAALQRDLDDLVAATASSNADDEHDPEGATIAFEREQLRALIADANGQLGEIDAAVVRVEIGIYGRCIDCGAAIDPQRLAVRPAAARCVDCAGSGRETTGGARR